MTYPTGEVVQTAYDFGWHVASVTSLTHGLAYASGMTYNALDQLKQMTVGPAANGVTTSLSYYGDGGPATAARQ